MIVCLLAQQLCQRVIVILGSKFFQESLAEKPFNISELETTIELHSIGTQIALRNSRGCGFRIGYLS